MLGVAYLSYLLAEMVHFSGIIRLVNFYLIIYKLMLFLIKYIHILIRKKDTLLRKI